MKWYLMVLKQYATFSGRARRKEYWMFFLISTIISILIGIATGAYLPENVGKPDIIGSIYSLAILLPSIAVAVRRMHDVGKSGWFILIPIYNLILACTDGDKGPNEYGSDPKDRNSGNATNNDLLDDQLIN